MIDPFTAITAATTAFKTVQKFVAAGQDFENTVGQMGKWYTAVSDFRKGQQMQKKPPLFKKLFDSGSVEEEALALLIHEKKITEQEKELQTLLNWRYGFGTWDELKEMRRKIAKKREKEVYKQAEMRRAFVETITIAGALLALVLLLATIVYFIGKAQGKWQMFIFMLVVCLCLMVFCLGYLVWADDQIDNPPEMPETELEKRARSIKYRLKDLNRQYRT